LDVVPAEFGDFLNIGSTKLDAKRVSNVSCKSSNVNVS